MRKNPAGSASWFVRLFELDFRPIELYTHSKSKLDIRFGITTQVLDFKAAAGGSSAKQKIVK